MTINVNTPSKIIKGLIIHGADCDMRRQANIFTSHERLSTKMNRTPILVSGNHMSYPDEAVVRELAGGEVVGATDGAVCGLCKAAITSQHVRTILGNTYCTKCTLEKVDNFAKHIAELSSEGIRQIIETENSADESQQRLQALVDLHMQNVFGANTSPLALHQGLPVPPLEESGFQLADQPKTGASARKYSGTPDCKKYQRLRPPISKYSLRPRKPASRK